MREYASKPKRPASVAPPQSLPPTRPFAVEPQTLGAARAVSSKHAASHLKHASEHGDDEARGLKSEGRGRPLPASVRQKMESAFGHDFSAVRIHRDRSPSALRAPAYARGNHLYFAPGEYEPSSTEGQALLGHELTHVVQQRAGRVATPQGTGAPVNSDGRHEMEAHASGLKAALGERVKLQSSSARTPSKIAGSSGTPIQRGKYTKEQLKRHARAYERARYYHATRNANVGSIAQNGLDPARGGGAGGAAATSGNANFVAHSQRRIHLTKSEDTGRFYQNYLGGPASAEILRAFARRNVRKNVEVDPDSSRAMKAYRTTSAIKGKYIRPLSLVHESKRDARRRSRARYKAIRSNYHGDKPSVKKIRRIHRKALEKGYVSD
jgi:hypothetical protein